MNKSPFRKLLLLRFDITNRVPGCPGCKQRGGLYVLNHPMKGMDLVLIKQQYPGAKVVVGRHRLWEMRRFFSADELIPTGGALDKIVDAIAQGSDVFIFYRRIAKMLTRRSIRLVMEATGCELFMVNIRSRRRAFEQVFRRNNNFTKLLYFMKLVLWGNNVLLTGRRIRHYNAAQLKAHVAEVFS